MVKRKACAFLTTSIVAPLFCVLWLMIFDGESMIGSLSAYLFYALYSVPLILVYGLPISCMSDFLTKKFTEVHRVRAALLIHELFGLAFTFIFTLLLEPDLYQNGTLFNDITFFFIWGSTLSSFVFWAADEFIRCKQTGNWSLGSKGLA